MVTFINPLREVITRLAPVVSWNYGVTGTERNRIDIKYRKYNIGDKFP